MTIRVAAIEVNHWHSLWDAAYLRHLARMPDVRLVALQDPDAAVAARRAAQVGNPAVYTDYQLMLSEIRPDFVLALGRHSVMAEIAHHLLDNGYPFLMEKPMGRHADEVRRIAEKADTTRGFAAVPLSQRYQPFVKQAQRMIVEGRFGPLSHIYFRLNRPTSARYPAWDAAWMLDPAVANGGCLRNLGPHGLDLFLWLTGEEADVTGADISSRALGQPVEDYATVTIRSASGIIGTVEVGNVFPRDGTDGEFKVSGRDALLTAKDGVMRIITGSGEETQSVQLRDSLSYLVLRDTLDRWQRGEKPPIDAHDCYRAVRLIDEAYRIARAMGTRATSHPNPTP